MGAYALDFENAFSTLVNAASVTNGGENTSAAISLDGALGVEITFQVAYGATASAPVEFHFVVSIDGSTYQVRADKPYAVAMPANTTSTTHYHRVFIPASYADSFKVLTYNPSGATVTVTIRYKLITGVTA